LANAGQKTVNPQTKITLDRPSHARLTASSSSFPSSFLPLSNFLFQLIFLFLQSNSRIYATMPRAKSVKPEVAPQPVADVTQITVSKPEFTRTRDAVRFSSMSRRIHDAPIFATRPIPISSVSHVGRNCVMLRQTRLSRRVATTQTFKDPTLTATTACHLVGRSSEGPSECHCRLY